MDHQMLRMNANKTKFLLTHVGAIMNRNNYKAGGKLQIFGHWTPRSVLFFNYVTSSFACPTQNKKISLEENLPSKENLKDSMDPG